jgi:hypothetical protein
MLDYLQQLSEVLGTGLFMLKLGGSKSKSSTQAQSTQEQFQGLKDTDTIAAVKSLIASKGLTPEIQAQKDVKSNVLNKLLTSMGSYTTEKAFSDSSTAMDGLLRQLRETSSPTIARAVEASGTSGSSMSALLSNDADARNAQAAAKVGTDLAAQYGGITANLFGTAGSMSNIDATATTALLQAIEDMKISTGQSQSTSSGSSKAISASVG